MKIKNSLIAAFILLYSLLHMNETRPPPAQAGMRKPISRLATTESDTTRSVMLINALFIIQMFFFVYRL